MLSHTSDTPLDDVEYLARSEHRVTALMALASQPQTRADLQELTGTSASTIRRTVREFERRQWIAMDGHQFEATQLGEFVAAGMREVIDRFETEHQLRDIWQWLPSEESGFTVDMATDAVVTVASSDAPYDPVNRFVAVLRGTDRFRFVGHDVALLEPCKDELRQRILDGMQTAVIDSPSSATYILSAYEDHCSGPLASGNLQVQVHDDLPAYGLCLFDDRIAIGGYHPKSGTVQVLLDTDDPGAREWAEQTYDAYRREARPLTPETVAP